MERAKKIPRVPKLTTQLPPHLHARLHATSTVLKTSVEELIESALESQFQGLDEAQRELIDRVAATLVMKTDLGNPER